MEFIVVIPARYGSTRFPGKPLALIKDKPMIQHVVERAGEAGAQQVVVATDDDRIANAVRSFGAEVCMTREDHESGTTRIAEVLHSYGIDDDTIVVNVQGDEPFIPSANIQQVARNLHENSDFPMATLAYPISDELDIFNPNVVKVLADKNKRAMYFSRAPIPFDRDEFIAKQEGGANHIELRSLTSIYLRHIGIYGYRAGFVKQYDTLATTQLEKSESLEQLRVLWHGYPIHIDVAKHAPPHGVDTPDDLARFA
ncbi:3-deoxy-manno-octulosonate cytidylyltransferase [Glaciecola sp. MH2013]|uniref:3-deoxy-manno-octulosonate cytidylyltransferase n=1 Tax=Glaciecola sp. MH2013 TaxID=2785524 RepID=UPI00189FEC6D|nr:3-deoxy-manno-octulosonate cytidylyltransferase [Glaciecola sp. MH2013]MBF7072659.1 3-deoxy-manno-octulosonate cytidylyltransferase [Glaciecola sp. MH2013]